MNEIARNEIAREEGLASGSGQLLDFRERRRAGDRRKANCEGYTYVETVGWICRREQFRRREDTCEPLLSGERPLSESMQPPQRDPDRALDSTAISATAP